LSGEGDNAQRFSFQIVMPGAPEAADWESDMALIERKAHADALIWRAPVRHPNTGHSINIYPVTAQLLKGRRLPSSNDLQTFSQADSEIRN
jgi:hypothetical protein